MNETKRKRWVPEQKCERVIYALGCIPAVLCRVTDLIINSSGVRKKFRKILHDFYVALVKKWKYSKLIRLLLRNLIIILNTIYLSITKLDQYT